MDFQGYCFYQTEKRHFRPLPVLDEEIKSSICGECFENLKELADNCDFGHKEDFSVGDKFIADMSDEEKQQLLRETMESLNI